MRDSVKFVLINLSITAIFAIVLYFLTISFSCSNSWQKTGLIYQGVGVSLLSFFVVVRGRYGLQALDQEFKTNISGSLERFLPVFGLTFSLVGLIFQF